MNHMKNEIDKINKMYDDMMARGGGKAPCDTLCWGCDAKLSKIWHWGQGENAKQDDPQ